MRVNISQRSEYVPEWNGNRELDVDDQIKVRWKNLSKSERSKFTKTSDQEIIIHNVATKTEKEIEDEVNGQADLHMKIVDREDDMIKAMEITIENLEVDEDGRDKVIDTWDKLVKLETKRFDDLIAEITREVRKVQQFDGELSKN